MHLARHHHLASALLVTTVLACSKSDSSSARYAEDEEEEVVPVPATQPTYRPPAPLMTARREQMERQEQMEREATSAPTEDTGRTDAAITLSDEQIVSVLAAMDERSIELAKLASARSQSHFVQNYAAMVVAHRQDSQNKRQRFVERARMTPQPSETSLGQSEDMKKDYDALKGKSGKGFDTAFVDTVMENEREALQFIDDQALVAVKSAELKTLIENARASLDSDIKATKDLKIALERNLDQAPPKKKPAPVPPGV
jgi:predicted outer membrane protein